MDDCEYIWRPPMYSYTIITQVCHAINSVLGPTYLHLPRDVNEIREKASEFELKFGMTQAIGCIDGTHVAIN